MRFKINTFFALLTASLIAAGQTPSAAVGEQPKKPNIVLILVDDLGYGDLSSYGAKDLQSPEIDELMTHGMRFDNFYANCCVCSPTRASVLTGRYPELVGVPGVIRTRPADSWGHLSSNAVLLPELLRKVGYHTAIVGKWHLGLEVTNRPTDRGFDHFHGFLGDMMDDYYKHRRHGINYMRLNEQEIDPPGHATDLFSQWASDYLQERSKSDQPFFLYLAFNAPHTPIQPPKKWVEKVIARQPGITQQRAKLVALIEHMDDGIGRVMKTLKDTGLQDNTLVVFTSDNGGQSNVGANNGDLRDGKQSMYEGGLKVPMCAVWPDKISPGTRSSRIQITMDLLPTICQVVGVTVQNEIDGSTFFDTLLGKQQSPENRDLFFTRREGNVRYQGKTIDAIRRGDWKLLQNSPFAPLELYNLKDDPQEQNDLSQKSRKQFNELSAALRKHIQRGGAVPWQKVE